MFPSTDTTLWTVWRVDETKHLGDYRGESAPEALARALDDHGHMARANENGGVDLATNGGYGTYEVRPHGRDEKVRVEARCTMEGRERLGVGQGPVNDRDHHVRPHMVAVAKTDKALGVCHRDDDRDGDLEWIPWSHMIGASEVQQPGDEGRLVVTRWIAVKKGWEDHPDPYAHPPPKIRWDRERN